MVHLDHIKFKGKENINCTLVGVQPRYCYSNEMSFKVLI